MSDDDRPQAVPPAETPPGPHGSAAVPDYPTIRVGGFLQLDGRILVVKQGRGEERYWLLPGGGVRFGETLSEALRREIDEELGLRVAVGRLLAIVESISPEPAYPKHVVHLVFEVSAAPEADIVPQEATVLRAEFLDERGLSTIDLRPPIAEFLLDCLRELPSSPQYLGRRW
jgi:ADP-ribose pyrophosphatase YjhB (NUDIX family)